MAKGLIGSTHGHSSPDRKMGRYQDLDKGTWRERYQRAQGWWREAGTSVKQSTKHRAAKKRRERDKKESKNLDS